MAAETITEDRVRQWFVQTKLKKIPRPEVIKEVALRCSLIKARITHPRLTDAAAHILEGQKLTKALQIWLREAMRKMAKPLRPEVSSFAEALDQFVPLLELHPSYAEPDKRWQTHVHTVHGLIKAAILTTGRRRAKLGDPVGPIIMVTCKALEAIDGQGHAPEAVLSELKRKTPPLRDGL